METENTVSESIVEHTPDFKEDVVDFGRKIILIGKDVINFILSKLLTQDGIERELNPEEKLVEEVNKARIELMMAKSSFVHVSDKDLVDQTIYAISAAEKKYQYLLKQAKKQKITISRENIDYNRNMYKKDQFNI